ncbi:hypothetical protein [Paraburkholderia strydomiana]|jgi:acetylornithine deacetylase
MERAQPRTERLLDVAHKRNEYVALAQLDACDAFLARLIGGLQ